MSGWNWSQEERNNLKNFCQNNHGQLKELGKRAVTEELKKILPRKAMLNILNEAKDYPWGEELHRMFVGAPRCTQGTIWGYRKFGKRRCYEGRE